MKKTIALLLCLLFFCGAAHAAKAKNVILIIGDGMGPEAMGLLIQYARYAPGSIYPDRKSNLEKFAAVSTMGMMLTNTEDSIVTDSACSATQFSSGAFSLPQRLGVDFLGNPTVTVLEKAKAAGKSTGLVTDVFIQDATPGAFASHEISRKNRDSINSQLLNSGTDVILGGGMKYMRSSGGLQAALENGYTIVTTKRELLNAAEDKLLGIFAEDGLPFMITAPSSPDIKDMAEAALTRLSKNKKGFFLMLEAGKIDWAAHNNDPAAMLHELLAFDKALGYVMDWAGKRKDTVIIVTSDHGTGGFAFTYGSAHDNGLADEGVEKTLYEGDYYVSYRVLDALYNQKKDFYSLRREFEALPKEKQTNKAKAEFLSKGTGVEITEAFIKKHGGDFDKLFKAVNDSRGIAFAAGAHTSVPVTVLQYGKGFGNYGGVYHATDLARKINASFGF